MHLWGTSPESNFSSYKDLLKEWEGETPPLSPWVGPFAAKGVGAGGGVSDGLGVEKEGANDQSPLPPEFSMDPSLHKLMIVSQHLPSRIQEAG